MKSIISALLIFLAASAAGAQVPVDVSHKVPADGVVIVENVVGSVKVVGTDDNVVRVTGTVGDDLQLELTAEGRQVKARVIYPKGETESEADLVVRMPRTADLLLSIISGDLDVTDIDGEVQMRSANGAVSATDLGGRVNIETVNARVTATDLRGTVQIESAAGAITVREGSPTLRAQSISGRIDIDAPTKTCVAESASGSIAIRGATQGIVARSVSGSIDAAGEDLMELTMENVSGSLTFDGTLDEKARVNTRSHSGSTTLRLPGSLAADFRISTFSGKIESDFGPEEQQKSRSHVGGSQRNFSTGKGAWISAESFAGSITLDAR